MRRCGEERAAGAGRGRRGAPGGGVGTERSPSRTRGRGEEDGGKAGGGPRRLPRTRLPRARKEGRRRPMNGRSCCWREAGVRGAFRAAQPRQHRPLQVSSRLRCAPHLVPPSPRRGASSRSAGGVSLQTLRAGHVSASLAPLHPPSATRTSHTGPHSSPPPPSASPLEGRRRSQAARRRRVAALRHRSIPRATHQSPDNAPSNSNATFIATAGASVGPEAARAPASPSDRSTLPPFRLALSARVAIAIASSGSVQRKSESGVTTGAENPGRDRPRACRRPEEGTGAGRPRRVVLRGRKGPESTRKKRSTPAMSIGMNERTRMKKNGGQEDAEGAPVNARRQQWRAAGQCQLAAAASSAAVPICPRQSLPLACQPPHAHRAAGVHAPRSPQAARSPPPVATPARARRALPKREASQTNPRAPPVSHNPVSHRPVSHRIDSLPVAVARVAGRSSRSFQRSGLWSVASPSRSPQSTSPSLPSRTRSIS